MVASKSHIYCKPLATRAVPNPGCFTLSARLVLVVYATAMPLGTMPFTFEGRTYSFEFFLSLLCASVVMLELAGGALKKPKCNQGFLAGLGLWLIANIVSMLFDCNTETLVLVVRMILKPMFGYMVFIVLMNNGRLTVMLKAYVVGCAVAGLFTAAFFAQGGNVEQLRQTTFSGLDPGDFRLDVFGGIAGMGASNLMPLWICIALSFNARSRSVRAILFIFVAYFGVLSLAALRREVLVEGMVGLILLFSVLPGKRRLPVLFIGIVMVFVAVAVVSVSERWTERLFSESRDEFESLTDPRLVLLMNTPREMQQAPFFGQGPGSYRWLMLKYFPDASTWLQERGIAAHNTFSRAAVETGIIGLIGVVLMTASLGWRAYFRRSGHAPVTGVLRLSAILLFLHVGVVLFFGDGIITNTTWYFMGVLLYLDRRLCREDERVFMPLEQKRLIV